jgi:peptidoglycan L-alanyl-D-glutamate endopeptidase CwlK
MAVDERSEQNIKTLKPEVQVLARRLIEEATAQGIHVKVISGYRSYAEQDELYAKGRTEPGPRVTKARGGYSWHNFQIAFDIGIFSEDGKKYLGESPDYKKCGKIGESLGLEWGGSWKEFVDEPHFQFNPHNLSLAQCREWTAERKSIVT